MSRHVFPEADIHPAAADQIGNRAHKETIEEVQAAIQQHAVVVVGMSGNPHVGNVCKHLNKAGIEHHYLGYGSYFSQWQRRLALKMWCGWPTFPMVFAKGKLLGGEDTTLELLKSGELENLLSESN